VQRLGHDQGTGSGVLYGGLAALAVRPAPGVRVPGLVREDHLADGGVLDLAREGQVLLVSGRIAHLERAGDLGDVQDRHRDGEGQRDRVAQVDQGMHLGQGPFLAETAQQRFRGAPVLGRLEAHGREGAPPGLDLRQFALGGHRRQPRPGNGREPFDDRTGRCAAGGGRRAAGGGRRAAGDAFGVQDSRDQRREVPPDLRRMLKVHDPPKYMIPGCLMGRM
jgi:hypothetical protein